MRACKAAPSSPQYAVEAGYQALLQGDIQGALSQYSRASHLHELDMEAMYGSIECDLLNGKVGTATACAAASCKAAMLGTVNRHVWRHDVASSHWQGRKKILHHQP